MRFSLPALRRPTACLLVFLMFFSTPGMVAASEHSEQTEVTAMAQLQPENEGEFSIAILGDNEYGNQPESATQQGLFSIASVSSGNPSFTHERKPVTSQLNITADEVTGVLQFRYPFTVPPGRDNLLPDVSLLYNSQDTDQGSPFGYGWSLSIPTIERLNKKGTEKLFSEDAFTSTFDGELATTTQGNIYSAKIELGNFFEYEYQNNFWTATNKEGTVYTFGATASSRQDDASGVKVYRWMLSEVRDTNDNFVRYEYFKDAGQIYPSKIIYTGQGTQDGIFEIEFLRESRADNLTLYSTGFGVTSNYRISEIQTKVQGIWVRKYALAYATGDNGLRSVLAQITESGQDAQGNSVTLPVTTFNYQRQTRGNIWIETTQYALPEYFVKNLPDGFDLGTRVADLNGDGLSDVFRETNYLSSKAYINALDCACLTLDPNIVVPVIFEPDLGRLADVNGDGLVDMFNDSQEALIHDVSATSWTVDNRFFLPVSFIDGATGGGDAGMRMVDVNGDGLTDVIRSYEIIGSQMFNDVFLNRGWSGWETAQFQLPSGVYFANNDSDPPQDDLGVRAMDVNGDGLVDIVQKVVISGNPVTRLDNVYLNTGAGWTLASQLGNQEWFSTYGVREPIRIVDINADGLPDLVKGSSSYRFKINKGDGSWEDASFNLPELFIDGSNKSDIGTRFVDLNGDGLLDIVRADTEGNYKKVYLNQDVVPDLLSSINHSNGAQTDVTYKASTQYIDDQGNQASPNLPQRIQTVNTIVVDDGLGNTATSTFEYLGGQNYYSDPYDRKYAGFEIITKTDPLGHVTKTYYHQGNEVNTSLGETDDHKSLIGRSYKVEQYDDSGNLYSVTYSDWDYMSLGNDRYFVKLAATVESTYDGDSSHKDSAHTFVYDNANGNLISKTELGEVTVTNTLTGAYINTGSDTRSTTIDYSANSTAHILGLPKTETVYDNASQKVAETRYYYDNLALGSVNVGNPTKQEQWVSGTSYVDNEWSYNTYGLVTQEKDPRDNTTTYSYDTFNLYPASITNALSHVASFEYDYSSGAVIKTVDPNGNTYETVYDGLDRVLFEKIPDPDGGSSLKTKTTITYTDDIVPRRVYTINHLDSNRDASHRAYFDGLDRIVQSRTETETTNVYATTDYIYNARGELAQESLPYLSSGSAYTSPTTDATLLSTSVYDPLGRIIRLTNVVGTTAYNYNDWQVTTTDALGNNKDVVKDAYDNLVQVNEYNSGQTYTTNYEYDTLNNLTKLTDAQGNLRNFAYDGLSRRLSAEDLHAPADSTFGLWTYGYDPAGNLVTQLDPEGQTVNYYINNLIFR